MDSAVKLGGCLTVNTPHPGRVLPRIITSTSKYPKYGIDSPLAAVRLSHLQLFNLYLSQSKFAEKKLSFIVVTFEPVYHNDGTSTPFTTRFSTEHQPTSCFNNSGDTEVDLEPRSAPPGVWLETTGGSSFLSAQKTLFELQASVLSEHQRA